MRIQQIKGYYVNFVWNVIHVGFFSSWARELLNLEKFC